MMLLLFILLSGFYGICQAGSAPDLAALVDEALSRNPVINALHKQEQALWQRPPQAAAWEDPELVFGVKNLPVDNFDFNKQDMTQKYISVSQKIPFPGITSLRRESAAALARSSGQAVEDAALRLVRDVKKNFYQLYFIERALQITTKNRDLLMQLAEMTQSRYEVGTGLLEDMLRAQVEIEKNREELINLRQQRDTIHASMNRLLNRPAGKPFSGIPRVTQTEFSCSCGALEKQALEGHPLLQSLEQHIQQREAESQLAKKSYFPHFVVTAAYGQREDRMHARPALTRVMKPSGLFTDVATRPLNYDTDRPDFFSFMVGVTVPIWFSGKQNRRVSETRLQIEQAKAEYEARKNDILFSIRDLVARVRRGADLLDLYEDSIIPKARQSFSADMTAYQVDRIDFLSLLDSQITLYNYRIEFERILSDYEKSLADLEVAVGKKLFQIGAGNQPSG